MTDLERMHTSKLYIDRLANGEDPISGEDLPEDTVLNNLYLCRAFSFVSSILEEVIKNGGFISSKKEAKSAFRITEDQRSKIRMSEEPVVVTAIMNRVSAVLDRDVKRISAYKVAEWLEREGLLERKLSEESGRYERVATSAGEVIGIETKEANYNDKTIKKNYYNLNAQAFIIANLEAIANQSFVELEEAKEEAKEKPAPKKKRATKKK